MLGITVSGIPVKKSASLVAIGDGSTAFTAGNAGAALLSTAELPNIAATPFVSLLTADFANLLPFLIVRLGVLGTARLFGDDGLEVLAIRGQQRRLVDQNGIYVYGERTAPGQWRCVREPRPGLHSRVIHGHGYR